MKTKNVLLIALMAVSVSVLAANEPLNSRIAVLNQKTGVFKVIYEGGKAGTVTLTISDNVGNVVFREGIKTVGGFIRPVNFSGMERGLYTVTVADESGEQTQTINYENDAVVKNVHIAKIGEDGRYLLAVANGTEPINVRIYDGENNLVHSENLAVNGDFGLVFNLKQVTGTPSFEVTDNTGNDLIIK